MVEPDKITIPPEVGEAQDQNARMIQTVVRGKWLILFLPVLFAAVTWAYYDNRIPGLEVTPRYRATAKIQVSARSLDVLTGETTPAEARLAALARQQEQLFRSEKVLRPLAGDPRLAELRTFQDPGDVPILAVLNANLRARTDPRTDQVAVSFEGPIRAEARVVADAAVDAYIEYHRRFAQEKAQNASALLAAKRDEVLEEQKAINARILELKREHKIPYEDLRNPLASTYEAHMSSRQAALTELHRAQVELSRVEEAAETPETFLDYGTVRRSTAPNQVLENSIVQFERQRQDKTNELIRSRGVLAEDGPQMTAIKEQIAALEREIDGIVLRYAEEGLREARDRVQGLRHEYEKFNELILEIEADYFPLENVISELRNLQTERSLLQAQVSKFEAMIDEYDVTGQSGAVNIHIIENARVFPKAVYPETEKMALMAAAIGAMLAVGFVFVRGILDRRIWSVEEVPYLLGTDVVGVFPELLTRKRAKVGRIVEEDPASLAAESIRSLRTSCSFGLPDNGRGIVFVTSSVSGEGKSVIASNLAIALAQSGRKTLLIDADLRSPGQNEIFAVIGRRGLGDILAGEIDHEAGLVRSVTAEGLDLLPAGDASLGAAELVEGGSVRELFAMLREEYDCIVVDSSPVLETSETRVLASISSLTVFVMRMNKSTAPNGQRAVGILRHVGAEVLGVMLNGAKSRRGAKAYAGGLTYGYGYGYGYGKYRSGGGGERAQMQEVASRRAPTPDSSQRPALGELQGGG